MSPGMSEMRQGPARLASGAMRTLIVGGGPAGVTAAIQARELGAEEFLPSSPAAEGA